MAETLKNISAGLPWWMHAALWVSIALVVASFCIPPYAVIDSSVIAAVGEILGGAWLFKLTCGLPEYIKAGASVRATKGDASIEITPTNKQD